MKVKALVPDTDRDDSEALGATLVRPLMEEEAIVKGSGRGSAKQGNDVELGWGPRAAVRDAHKTTTPGEDVPPTTKRHRTEPLAKHLLR